MLLDKDNRPLLVVEAKKESIDPLSAKKQAQILDDLKRIKSEEIRYYEIGINIIDLARRSKQIYLDERRTPEERRQLLTYLFSSMTLNGKSLTCHPKAAVEALSKRIQERLKAKNTFEQKKALSNKALSGKSSKNDFVLPFLDEFRTANWSKIKSELQFSGILGLCSSLALQNQFLS